MACSCQIDFRGYRSRVALRLPGTTKLFQFSNSPFVFVTVVARSACDEAIHTIFSHRISGLRRGACHRAPATRWLAATTRLHIPAAQIVPGLTQIRAPKENRGRGECRVPAAPAASRAKVKKHTRIIHHRLTRLNPAFPARGKINSRVQLHEAV